MRRAVIVGAGKMGRGWGRNVKNHADSVELAGWVDILPDAAANAADEIGIPGIYTGDDLAKALADLRPDFVIDVTVPEAHHDVTLQALAAGIPVLGEKPMASSMEQAREMVAASERAGKLYMVSQSRRYDPRIHAYKRLIDTQVGPLGMLKSDFYLGPHFGGFRDEMDHVLILDMAIHTLDAARYLSDADPVAVYCEEYNPSWSWFRGAASATALFEMTGGLRYLYAGSWCGEGRQTSWEAEWRAVGPHGTATWDGADDILADRVVGPVEFFSNCERHTGEIHEVSRGTAGALEDFLRALDTGAAPMGECHDNIKSLAMVFAAIESADTGKRVAVAV